MLVEMESTRRPGVPDHIPAGAVGSPPEMKRFFQVLQFQLQHLQKSKAEEDIPAGTSGSSGSKGKTPVTSSTSDCGHHTGLEDGDDHIL